MFWADDSHEGAIDCGMSLLFQVILTQVFAAYAPPAAADLAPMVARWDVGRMRRQRKPQLYTVPQSSNIQLRQSAAAKG